MASKHKSTTRSDPAKVSGVIVNETVESLRKSTTKPAQNIMNEKERLQRISTAAYYRAERRGFTDGNEIQDWLEAESEIDGEPQSQADTGH